MAMKDVITLAREAGLPEAVMQARGTWAQVERFAALVREEDAKRIAILEQDNANCRKAVSDLMDKLNEQDKQHHLANAGKEIEQEPVAWKDSIYCDDGVTTTREHLLLGYDGWEHLPDATDLYTTPPTAAVAARQMRDAAVKVCHIYADKYIDGDIADNLAKDIAALPVQEIQWRDLRDVEIGYIYDDVSRTIGQEPTLIRFAKAVIAKFKEKQL